MPIYTIYRWLYRHRCGKDEQNPLTVRIFNVEYGMVHTQFLDMCMSSQSTAEGIFTKMQEALKKHEISMAELCRS